MACIESAGSLEIAMASRTDLPEGSYLKVSHVDRAHHWPKVSDINPVEHLRRKYTARSELLQFRPDRPC